MSDNQREVRPEDFRKAADVLRKGGLARGVYENLEDGSHCTIGALVEAVPEARYFEHVRPHLDLLTEMLGNPRRGGSDPSWTAVTDFSDRAPSVDEPITLLEQAAEKLEAERGVL